MAAKEKLIRVMEIIQQTDEQHPITAQKICETLRLYGIEAERKSVCRDINTLRDCGWDILPCADNRNGWYLASRTFEDWELKLLIDAVGENAVLPQKEAEALVEKLCGLSSAAGCLSLRAMTPLYVTGRTGSPATKRCLDAAIRAMQSGAQLQFHYARLQPDMTRPPQKDGRLYTVNPYAMLCRDGRYYLVCNTVPHENLSFYRLDRLSDAAVADTPLVPAEHFLGANADVAIGEFVHSSLLRYGGEKVHLVLETHGDMADELADSFGTRARLQPQPDGTFRYEADVNDGNGLIYWLLQHADYVKVLEPASVKDRLLEKVNAIQNLYQIRKEETT